MAAPQLVQDAGFAMKRIIDDVDANTQYLCEAAPGTASSDPYWRIQRQIISGTVTTFTHAGSGKFDQIADNRASLTYN